ncbi:MAG TPA: hypothetical protein VJC08_04290, partial [bacterium]|nr:hypothetical protein [bacterium]
YKLATALFKSGNSKMMLNFTALTDDRLLLSPFDPPSAGPSSNGSESCFQKILLPPSTSAKSPKAFLQCF